MTVQSTADPSPDREITSGGSFASVLAQPLQANEDLLIINDTTGTDHAITVTPRGANGATYTRNIRSKGAEVIRGQGNNLAQIDSADAGVLWFRGPRGTFDGTVWHGQVSSFQAGTWTVGILDASGNRTIAPLVSGAVAGAHGVWIITAGVTDTGGITLSDGTSTKSVCVPGTNAVTTVANVFPTYKFAVFASKTYTIAGTGLIVIGGNGVIVAG